MQTETSKLEDIIATVKDGTSIVIKAGAGTGKTTTLIKLSNEIDKRSLYVCFTKGIQIEAVKKFKPRVDCKTFHSIAYNHLKIFKMTSRLSPFLRYDEIKEVIKENLPSIKNPSFSELQYISSTMNDYCNSHYVEVYDYLKESYHLRDKDIFPHIILEEMANLLKDYFEKMTDPKGSYSFTHDIYLKNFQLQNVNLGYEIIYLDEAQDTNPVLLEILRSQKHTQFVIVGDEYQSIFGFRNSKNAFKAFGKMPQFYLLNSYRFNQKIAEKSNKLLNFIGADINVTGVATKTSVNDYCIIVRKNLTLFYELVKAYEDNRKVYIIGDLKDLFSKLYSARALKYLDREKVTDKYIKTFSSWEDFCKVDDPSHNIIINIINTFTNLHETITKIKKVIIKRREDADITVCTAHKAKGLEWDHVTISSDFRLKEDVYGDYEKIKEEFTKDQEGNLLYVAATRAKVELYLNFEEILGIDL